MSDSDGARSRSPQPPRRYSKRPLRGPYGQMLEAEMQKPEPRIHSRFHCSEDLKFLEELAGPPSAGPSRAPTVQSLDEPQVHRPRPAARAAPAAAAASPSPSPSPSASPAPRPAAAAQPATGARRKVSGGAPPCHQRTASSPSQLEGGQRRRHHALAGLLAEGHDRIYAAPQQLKLPTPAGPFSAPTRTKPPSVPSPCSTAATTSAPQPFEEGEHQQIDSSSDTEMRELPTVCRDPQDADTRSRKQKSPNRRKKRRPSA
ncbi:synapsin-1-like [Schistocerca serialis cubense]|uniref:synapsin-1-like n=1 Tax=Schistocerca serialis cubense TaxID=2023355 RepID=UPI00214F0A4F|nr:synapsin-1-like [Schistocerca serialis cubense]